MAEPTAPPVRVLVVDDDPQILHAWRRMLGGREFDVTTVTHGDEALGLLRADAFDVAVVDLVMPGTSGMDVLRAVKADRPEVEVVIMTGFGSVAAAVEAVRIGAYDFLTKPFKSTAEAVLAVRKAAERRRLIDRTRELEAALAAEGAFRDIVGRSPRMREVLAMVDSVAPGPTSVLIRGESGTGKELIARALHDRSRRRDRPFVAFNCAALAETLVDSELFGHVRGAFTGATGDHDGLFVGADGGTLLLDEVGEILPATQVRLLRVLQEGEVRPVGASESRRVDVRILAATNADLEARIRERRFRADLYWRLNVVAIDLPPLRERFEDIPLLAQHFLAKYAARVRKRVTRIEPDAMEALLAWRWPGNVRELENVIERALALHGAGAVLRVGDLPEALRRAVPTRGGGGAPDGPLPYARARNLAVTAFERRYAADLLRRAEGNVAQAARLAGLDRSNFRRLLRRCGVDASEFRD